MGEGIQDSGLSDEEDYLTWGREGSMRRIRGNSFGGYKRRAPEGSSSSGALHRPTHCWAGDENLFRRHLMSFLYIITCFWGICSTELKFFLAVIPLSTYCPRSDGQSSRK